MHEGMLTAGEPYPRTTLFDKLTSQIWERSAGQAMLSATASAHVNASDLRPTTLRTEICQGHVTLNMLRGCAFRGLRGGGDVMLVAAAYLTHVSMPGQKQLSGHALEERFLVGAHLRSEYLRPLKSVTISNRHTYSHC